MGAGLGGAAAVLGTTHGPWPGLGSADIGQIT